MIKNVIISILMAVVLLGGLSIFENAYHTMVVNEVSVNQVEDSDENFIAMRHVDAPRGAVTIVAVCVLIVGLCLIWVKPAKRLHI